ncbi:hypothetical protein N7540_012504 [Penicillium herquei]|nr:hypothetical protein N7540_012504 [Penicillium herquei]
MDPEMSKIKFEIQDSTDPNIYTVSNYTYHDPPPMKQLQLVPTALPIDSDTYSGPLRDTTTNDTTKANPMETSLSSASPVITEHGWHLPWNCIPSGLPYNYTPRQATLFPFSEPETERKTQQGVENEISEGHDAGTLCHTEV